MTRVLALLLSSALLLAALAAPARAGEADRETGPNFTVPVSLTAEAKAAYERGLAGYRAASEAREGQTGKISSAIKDLRRAKELAPKFPPPLYYLGILYQWTKEFEKARQVLQLAVQLNPTFHQALVELGDTYLWLKQPEKALDRYEQAISVAPEYGHAYAMRGFVRLKAGDFKAALEDIEQAKKLDKDDPGIEAALQMAKREVEGPGWQETFTCETDHYRVLTPVSQELADELGKHAELIYKTYTRIFPKASKEKRKFPIVVHASKQDYHEGGGPSGAGGHYEPLIRKLVLFRYEKDEDTKLVLYHEGFHQFLHDYLEDAPQWFNEGLGDFFGPSRYVEPVSRGLAGKSSAGMKLRPNPWRLDLIQQCVRAGRVRGWKQLMLMSQQELYDPQWVGIHYAQSWSIIYFLVRGKAPAGAEAGPYFKILQEYFKALRAGDGQETAFDKAFKGYDVAKLEAEWKEYVMGLQAEE